MLDHRRKCPGLINNVLFYIAWMAKCMVFTYPRSTWYGPRVYSENNASWRKSTMFCHETLSPDVTLACIIYMTIVAEHVLPLMEMKFLDSYGLSQLDNAP